MHNLSCENEFYLHENEKSFPYQRLSTQPRLVQRPGGTRKWPVEGRGGGVLLYGLDRHGPPFLRVLIISVVTEGGKNTLS